jgi:AcrR family transcriptional regulator
MAEAFQSSKPPVSTREALVRAAEQLMAQHGIEGAELREVNRLAGQRNQSAVHYHFRDRDGLISAIRDKHRPAIDDEMVQRLDQLEVSGQPTIREVVTAFVQPMAAPLTNDSGRDFLIILNEAATRTTASALIPSTLPYTAGFNRITGHLLAATPGSARRRHLFVGQAVLSVTAMLADTARQLKTGTITQPSADEAVEAIIDFVVGAIEGSQPPGTPEP